MYTKTDILNYILSKKEYLHSHFYINKIGLFGSFARDEQTESSDIDLIVEFDEGTPDIFEKKDEIRSLFKSAFNRDVDICTAKYIKPFAKRFILKDVVYV